MECNQMSTMVSQAEESVIHVDLTKPPIYPFWAASVPYKYLEILDRAQFDLSLFTVWSREGWRDPFGHNRALIHRYLAQNGLIANCLGIRELLGVQARGVDFFRHHVKNGVLFGPKSVVVNSSGLSYVSLLTEVDNDLILLWGECDRSWGPDEVIMLSQ